MATPSSPGIITVKSVDGGGNTPVTQLSAWASAQGTCAVPGTAEQCPSLAAPAGMAIVFQAKPSNTDVVYLGNSQANAQDHTVAVELDAGQAVLLFITNANLVWVDSLVAGEGVDIFVEQE